MKKTYKNKPVGKFRSKLEQTVDKLLAAVKKKGFRYQYEPFKIPYHLLIVKDQQPLFVSRNYVPDFVINDSWVLEVKGYFTAEQREKMLAVAKWSPYPIRFFFQNDSKLPGERKMKCSDWCHKHGFQYAIGDLPKEWV